MEDIQYKPKFSQEKILKSSPYLKNFLKIYLEKNPTIAQEIETIVREKAGMIAKEMEGNPSPKEKISKDEEK